MLTVPWPNWTLRRLTVIGAFGSILIAVSSWWVGAVPNSYQHGPPAAVAWLPIGGILPRSVFYVGLTGLCLAWLLVVRLVVASVSPLPPRRVVALVLWWALPMMAAMPLSSRDLWAYAAQGNLIHHGLDPYVDTPATLGGTFSVNVSPRWIDVAAPYGPLGLMLSHLVAVICGNHVVLTVFLTRVTTLAGFALTLWCLPRIAARLGRPIDLPLVLVLANPLMLVLGLGGGHNDLVMVGLMVAGVLALLRPGGTWTTLGLGAALLAAAVAVKSPAAIGVAFAGPIWLAARQRSEISPAITVRAVLTACAVAVSVAAVTFTLISVTSGYGLGWVTKVSATAPVVSWMSLPTGAAMLAELASGQVHGVTKLSPTIEAFRSSGLGLAALVIVGLWIAAVVAAGLPTGRVAPDRAALARRFSPVAYLTVALTAIVLLGPTVQPWYFCWPLPFVAVVHLRRGLLMFLLGSSIAFVAMIAPAGRGIQMSPMVLVIIAGAALIGWSALRGVPVRGTMARTGAEPGSVPGHHDADRPGTRVRPDGRPDL